MCLFKHNYPYLRQNEKMKSSQWYFEHDACKSFEEWKRGKENKQMLKLVRGGKGVNTNRERYERVCGWKIRKQSACQNRLTVLVRPCQTPLTLLLGPHQNLLTVQGVQKAYVSEINTIPVWDDNRYIDTEALKWKSLFNLRHSVLRGSPVFHETRTQ